MEKIYRETGNIGILVNNAGFTTAETIDDCNWEIWDNAVSGMLEAPFDLMRQAIPFT